MRQDTRERFEEGVGADGDADADVESVVKVLIIVALEFVYAADEVDAVARLGDRAKENAVAEGAPVLGCGETPHACSITAGGLPVAAVEFDSRGKGEGALEHDASGAELGEGEVTTATSGMTVTTGPCICLSPICVTALTGVGVGSDMVMDAVCMPPCT